MKSKKFVLAALALLAIIGLLALTSCKNDSVPETPEAKQEQAGGTEGNNDSTNTEDNTSGGGDSGTVPPEAHTHTFDEKEWKSDATGHWHPATCGHTGEKGGFASHTFGDWKVEEASATVKKVVEVCEECHYAQEVTDFVYIPAGTFQMGSTAGDADEKPDHEVTISKGYFMGRHEVTQKEWAEVMKVNVNGISESPSDFKNSSAENEDQTQRPVEMVSWYDAVVYCNRRSIAEDLTPCYTIGGKTNPNEWGTVPTLSDEPWEVTCNWEANGYRLPTEAEWEYAARAGDDTINARTWSGTKTDADLGTYAWFGGSNGTSEVGKKDPNAWGLHDMSGNVWEWCWDRYDKNYYSSSSTESVTNPTGPTGGSSVDGRVYRGGSWDNSADNCTVSFRDYYDPNFRSGHLGFRLVRPSSK